MLGRDAPSHAAHGAGEGAAAQRGSSSIKVSDPGSPWMLRVMPNEVMQGVDIATNAYKRLNARSAVLLYENTNAGIGNAKALGDTFKCRSAAKSFAHHASARVRGAVGGN